MNFPEFNSEQANAFTVVVLVCVVALVVVVNLMAQHGPVLVKILREVIKLVRCFRIRFSWEERSDDN